MKKIAMLLATVATFAALSAPADAKPRRVHAPVVAGAVLAGAALAAVAAHEAHYYGGPGYYYGPHYYGGPVYVGGYRRGWAW